jgi:hypothetical protein
MKFSNLIQSPIHDLPVCSVVTENITIRRNGRIVSYISSKSVKKKAASPPSSSSSSTSVI